MVARPSPCLMAAVSIVAGATFAWAAEFHDVAQRGRRFDRAEITIARGDTIRFSNQDEFLHHIYVDSPRFHFSSAEQSPGSTIDLQFPVGGEFQVRCRIHPTMVLTVTVK